MRSVGPIVSGDYRTKRDLGIVTMSAQQMDERVKSLVRDIVPMEGHFQWAFTVGGRIVACAPYLLLIHYSTPAMKADTYNWKNGGPLPSWVAPA